MGRFDAVKSSHLHQITETTGIDDGYHPSMHGYKLIALALFNRLCTM